MQMYTYLRMSNIHLDKMHTYRWHIYWAYICMCVYKVAECPAVFFFNMYIAHMCVYMYASIYVCHYTDAHRECNETLSLIEKKKSSQLCFSPSKTHGCSSALVENLALQYDLNIHKMEIDNYVAGCGSVWKMAMFLVSKKQDTFKEQLELIH